MEDADKEYLKDTIISLAIALVGTWAFCKFLFVPFLEIFGHNLAWWGYILLFIFFFGTSMASTAHQSACHKIAYGNDAVKKDENTRFCSQCGRAVRSSDIFCSHCGVNRQEKGN